MRPPGQAAAANRTVWFVRHGMREDFVNPAWCESAARPHDTPLAEVGREQAADVAAALAAESIDHIFASPFLRATQTAAVIATQLGLPLRIEAGLCEMLYRRWFPADPVLPDAAALARDFPCIATDRNSMVTPIYPEDETSAARRCERAVQALISSYPGNLVLVGHGGSIWALCQALATDASGIYPRMCCLIRVEELAAGWQIVADGRDASHLRVTEETLRLA